MIRQASGATVCWILGAKNLSYIYRSFFVLQALAYNLGVGRAHYH